MRRLSYAFNGFGTTVRDFGFSDNGGDCDGEQGNMSDCVEVGGGITVADPKALLAGGFET